MRPELPTDCPQNWKDLMSRCWDEDPAGRYLNFHLGNENEIFFFEPNYRFFVIPYFSLGFSAAIVR